jgi:hypothetical protein
MAAPRTQALKEYHRTQIAQFYLKQYTQAEMADMLGISIQTVNADLKAVRHMWAESAIFDMNEAKQRELARIDQLEREYWRAWEESQKEQTTAKTRGRIETEESDGDTYTIPEAYETQRQPRLGDPRYLQGVQWCIQQRCKILGIEAPTRQDITSGNHPLFDLASLSESQLEALARGLQDG